MSAKSLILGMLAVVTAAGCTRGYYRRQADAEVYQTVAQTDAQGDVNAPPFTIAVDPASRMFSPGDPDFPAMPPDDPASHEYMVYVDGMRASPYWRRSAKTPYVENPMWLSYLPRDEDGAVVLDLRAAVQTALLESPEYQSQKEELYLSALDVTFESFRFDAQFFGGSSIFFTSDGRRRSGTGGSSSRLDVNPLAPGNPLRVEKLSATGGELVVGFANSLVWQFAGPNDYMGNSLIDFSMVQPLLRAGGRTRILERLTVAERALLANARQMERFRRGFFTEIATGRDAGAGPSRRGGLFGGAGLQGFTGVGGGFGRVGGFGGGGFGGGGVGAASAGGFIGLLQAMQEIRNEAANLAALRDSVAQLEAQYDAGRIDRFQVDLAKQSLFSAQSRLLTLQAAYESSIDATAVSYGLPPDLDLRIADPMLDRFRLLDPAVTQLQNEVGDLLDTLRAQREDPNAPVAPRQDLADVRRRVEGLIADAYADFQTLEEALPNRRRVLNQLSQREEVRNGTVAREPFDTALLDKRVALLRDQITKLSARLAATLNTLDELEASAESDVAVRREAAITALTTLSGELAELALVQALARLDAITLRPVELEPQDAFQIAMEYRRDWKNARASLVDTWRLIAFNANDLLSSLDITFNGDISNVGDNPFNFDHQAGRLRAGLEFDAPLTRLAERNVYRQSLIEYQQARRGYYQYVDRVNQGLRNILRTMRLDELNFELRRQAILVAIAQVDLTQLRLEQPPQPGDTSQLSNTTARDLVTALGDLLAAQNNFLSVWVDFEVQRMNLDFDLGTMELDADGVWLDQTAPYTSFLPNWGGPCDEQEIIPLPEVPSNAPEEIPPPLEAVPTADST